jgi:hypothetical protein
MANTILHRVNYDEYKLEFLTITLPDSGAGERRKELSETPQTESA